MLKRHVPLLWAIALLGLLTAGGCTRNHYRLQADEQSLAVMGQYARGPGWQLQDYRLYAQRSSRMFDPFNPDRPPMPPDDPTAHALMHYVDGKRGYKHWGRNGRAPAVDMQYWRQYLPYDEQGQVVLDMQAAVQLAFVNSRDYQTEMEDLYLSALDVTFERFRFDAQFFAGNSTFFTTEGRVRGGGNSSSELSTVTGVDVTKLYPAGGELVAGLANTFLWEFSGTNQETAFTLLDFTFIQPLLRFGGRARVMEQLTQSERTLLVNVRQMEQFRHGFYALVVAGLDPGAGPNRNGLNFAAAVPGLNAGRVAGGYLALLQDKQEISNQEANVAALRLSRAQLEDYFQANLMRDRLQVDQATQALYNGQSRLLSLKTAHETALDNFKVLLGLPPQLPLEVKDPLLAGFNLLEPQITALQAEVEAVLQVARNQERPLDGVQLQGLLDELLALREPIEQQMQNVTTDIAQLESDEVLGPRVRQLNTLAQQPDVQQDNVDPEAYSPEGLEQRIRVLHTRLSAVHCALENSWLAHKELRAEVLTKEPVEARKELVEQAIAVLGYLVDLSLIQARARLDAVTLVPISLDADSAIETARLYRLDWMNARSELVDAWRQIEFEANALKSTLNVVVDGELGTTDDSPFRFRDTNGRLRMGVEFDAPLTRLVERNIYRETLINYQRARRNYMRFEDLVSQSLRNIVRTLELNQLDFELRRAAVFVAIDQYDLARERLYEPPKEAKDKTEFSPTTARDLVSALADLLSAQNEFLSAWVNYEALRLDLDFELGTMQLNSQYMWIDPGPIGQESQTEMLPPELLMPVDPNEPAQPELPPPPPVDGEETAATAVEPLPIEQTEQHTWMRLKFPTADITEN